MSDQFWVKFDVSESRAGVFLCC